MLVRSLVTEAANNARGEAEELRYGGPASDQSEHADQRADRAAKFNQPDVPGLLPPNIGWTAS